MDDGITPAGQMELRVKALQDNILTDVEIEAPTVTAKYVSNDEITPAGQMELRLEALQDTSLTDVKIEACSTVTAKYVFDDGGYYEFNVSPDGTNGAPEFSWCHVTKGDFNIYTRSFEHRGPTRSLPELLALGENDGAFGNLWRDDAVALIGIHEVAAAAIQEAIDQAVADASCAAAANLTRRLQQPAAAPPIPEVDDYFTAFEAACEQRAYCDSIVLNWGHDLGQLPGVEFGLALDTPEQILYGADPRQSKQLYLNGFWTSEHCLEEDLLEQFPDDAWARLGARNAAQDLLAIQRAGSELMEAQKQFTLQEIDQEKRDLLLRSMEKGKSFDEEHSDWNAYAARWLEGDLTDLFERVMEYVESLEPQRKPEAKRGPKPGARAVELDAP